MIIEIREQAREDLQLGFRFYEEQSPGLGRYFLECLFADIDSLNTFAGIHETVGDQRTRQGIGRLGLPPRPILDPAPTATGW